MSRKVLIVAVVLGLLVTAVPLKTDGAVPAQRAASTSLGSSRSVPLLCSGLEATASARSGAAGTGGAGVRPNGDCETGSGSGCPIHL